MPDTSSMTFVASFFQAFRSTIARTALDKGQECIDMFWLTKYEERGQPAVEKNWENSKTEQKTL